MRTKHFISAVVILLTLLSGGTIFADTVSTSGSPYEDMDFYYFDNETYSETTDLTNQIINPRIFARSLKLFIDQAWRRKLLTIDSLKRLLHKDEYSRLQKLLFCLAVNRA